MPEEQGMTTSDPEDWIHAIVRSLGEDRHARCGLMSLVQDAASSWAAIDVASPIGAAARHRLAMVNLTRLAEAIALPRPNRPS